MPFSNNNQSIKTIAVPMGDPAGIGPEIIVKALANRQIKGRIKCIITGSRAVLEKACAVCDIDKAVLNSPFVEIIEVPVEGFDPSSFEYGKVSASCGKASFEWIKKSIDLCMTGKACACATPPINKESLKAANVPFIGHTEIFAALTNTADPLTLFEVRNLRIFFLSRHVSLAKACTMVTKERIIDYVTRCTAALAQLGITSGTMAVAGLNPHSGEHGLFGSEEVTQVAPAVEELRSRGFDVEGPVSADSVFHLALQGRYNSVLSLYHDQGHIAAKTYDFERTISVTCGMPILRTSVDHGTAFDIAGTGKAGAVSMTEAIILAAKYGTAAAR